MLFAIQQYHQYRSSRFFLTNTVAKIIGKSQVRPTQAVELLQDAIRHRMKPWVPEEVGERPFLRDPAERTWVKRIGKCGEGSRLMIQFLGSKGIPARRVVLLDNNWQAINAGFEYLEDGRWVYEGAFNTTPNETIYTRAHPNGIQSFLAGKNPVSQHYKRFTYLNLSRIGINKVVTHPLPAWLSFCLETPSLLHAFSWLLGGLFCLGVSWAMWRRQGGHVLVGAP